MECTNRIVHDEETHRFDHLRVLVRPGIVELKRGLGLLKVGICHSGKGHFEGCLAVDPEAHGWAIELIVAPVPALQ